MSKIKIDIKNMLNKKNGAIILVLLILYSFTQAYTEYKWGIRTADIELSYQVELEELEKKLNETIALLEQPLNSSFYGLQKPTSYIISQVGSYTCMQNGTTGKLDWYSTNPLSVINSAFGNLTSSRTWKETVWLKGIFQVDSSISVPSYTRLVIDGMLNNTSTATDTYIVENKDASNTQIEIIGGEINGNDLTGSGSAGIILDHVTDSFIDNVYVHHISYLVASGAPSYGIYVDYCENVDVRNCRIEHCDHGGGILTSCIDCNFINCIGNQNAEGGAAGRRAANFVLYGVSGGWSIRCGVINCLSNGSLNQGIQAYRYTNDSLISRCTVIGAYNDYIVTGNFDTYHTTITNNRLIQPSGTGFGSTCGIDLSSYAYDTIVTSNSIINLPCGIYMDRRSNGTVVEDNYILIDTTTKFAIMCLSSHNVISNNIIEMTCDDYSYGIQLNSLDHNIEYNIVSGNRITIYAGYSAYGIAVPSSIGNTISNNIITMTGSASKDIYMVGTPASNIIEFNTISKTIIVAGTTNIIRYNTGYTTENSGNASGTTAITQAHGLASTPVYILVTPQADAGDCWVTADATNIYINFDGGGTKNFYWEARTWN